MAKLGLPESIRACLFDMDGVLTQTAKLHALAWKQMFDDYLAGRAGAGRAFVPFEAPRDYALYVDGKARADGVRSFLASRGIQLAEGPLDDGPQAQTIHGLGNRKNELVRKLMAQVGVEAYQGSIRFVRAAAGMGLAVAVVSASVNTMDVLKACGIEELFGVVVDGKVALEKGLKGKPAPDTFVEAAAMLGVSPARAAVFEDAIAGVTAGRAGAFGYVVGVDRLNQQAALEQAGADVVVRDLADLLLEDETDR